MKFILVKCKKIILIFLKRQTFELLFLDEIRGNKASLARRIGHTLSADEPQMTKEFAKNKSYLEKWAKALFASAIL